MGIKKLFILALLFAAIFVISIFSSIKFNFNIDSEVLFWTFSTVTQAYMGLIALLGMVIIFRLQILENNIQNYCEKARPYLQHFLGIPVDKIIEPTEIVEKGKNILLRSKEATYSQSEYGVLTTLIPAIEKTINEKSKLKNNIYKPAISLLSTIFCALLFLPLSRTPNLYFGLGALLIVLTLSFSSLILIIDSVKNIIQF